MKVLPSGMEILCDRCLSWRELAIQIHGLGQLSVYLGKITASYLRTYSNMQFQVDMRSKDEMKTVEYTKR